MWRIISPVIDYLWTHPYILFVAILLYVFIFFLSILVNGQKPGPNPFARSSVKEPAPLVTDTKARDKVLKQGFSSQKVPENLDAVVIGSGMGGLSAAVLLAKAGKKVLVLEQHDQAGGCCHTFVEKGFEFDVGVHYVGDMKGNSLVKCLNDFFTDGQLVWDSMGDVYDVVALGDPAKAKLFPLRSGTNEYRQCLVEKFPHEVEAIDKFLALLKKCGGSSLMFVLLKTLPRFISTMLVKTGLVHLLTSYFKLGSRSLQETVDQLTTNEDLKAVISYCFGDYGVLPGNVGFPMHAMLINHFNKGCYYPRGGASEIAFHMIPIIERSGGRVLVRADVSQILISPEGKAHGVRVTKGGNHFDVFARKIICAAGLTTTVTRLLPKEVAAKSSLSRLVKKIKPGVGCMSVFVGLKGTPEELNLPTYNTWAFTRNDQHKLCEEYLALTSDEAAHAEVPLLFVSFPAAKDSTHNSRYPGKSTCTLVTLANWSWFEDWQDERVKHRGMDYESVKNAIGRQMWKQTVALFPQLEDKVEYFDIGTPVTNNYYIGSTRGEIYGVDHDMGRFTPENVLALRPDTDIPGLFLSGQDMYTCGVIGAMCGGLMCGSAVLKRNLFRDAIAYKKKVSKQQQKIKAD